MFSKSPTTRWNAGRWLAVAAAAVVVAAMLPNARAGTLSDAPTVGDTLLAAVEAYNAHDAVGLPMPSADQLARLLEGEVVKVRRRMPMSDSTGGREERIRIVGYRYFERPRLLIWLSALDIGQQHADRLTEHLMWADDGGDSLWYQHMELPWPIRNRHWVIRNRKNTDLTLATAGVAWEHAWRLEEGGYDTAMALLGDGAVDGLDDRDGRKAIYLPINRGGWTMFELPGNRTLVAAHVSTVLGGWIPDGMVAGIVSRHLDSILSGLEARSETIHERYDTSYTIFTGDARAITRAMAVDAQRASAGAADANQSPVPVPTRKKP